MTSVSLGQEGPRAARPVAEDDRDTKQGGGEGQERTDGRREARVARHDVEHSAAGHHGSKRESGLEWDVGHRATEASSEQAWVLGTWMP